jgi:protein-tyrosine phosphatase
MADMLPAQNTAAGDSGAERLEGAPNFRSIPPLPARDGARIRPGRIFRSDGLHRLTDQDLPRLQALGIGAVIDLRNRTERSSAPSRLPQPQPWVHIHDSPPELAAVQGHGWRDVIEDEHFDAAAAHAWMADTYRRMPRALAPSVVAMVRSLAGIDRSPVPTVTHCMAGKDRTGFVIAVMLNLLGVSEDDILEDYLHSNLRRPPEDFTRSMLLFHGLPQDSRTVGAVTEVAAVYPDYLQAAMLSLTSDFGSLEGYLLGQGLQTAELARFREVLLT